MDDLNISLQSPRDQFRFEGGLLIGNDIFHGPACGSLESQLKQMKEILLSRRAQPVDVLTQCGMVNVVGSGFANNVIRNCRNSAIRIGHHGHSDPHATQVPFANVFVNNVLAGNTGELVRFDAPNEQLWRATSVWAEGQAKPGTQPPGVTVERVTVLQAERIAEFQADIAPILAAMLCPRSLEEACPAKQEVRVLEPREVGPVWMRGDPRQVARLGAREAVPGPVNPKPKKEN